MVDGCYIPNKIAERFHITLPIICLNLAPAGGRPRFVFRARGSVGVIRLREVKSHTNLTQLGCGQETMGGDDVTSISQLRVRTLWAPDPVENYSGTHGKRRLDEI